MVINTLLIIKMSIILSGIEFNNTYPNEKFFKLTNEEENHNGFQFKTGLNIDTNVFDPNIDCGNGIYFCHLNYISTWFSYRHGKEIVYIREVSIPENATVVEYTVLKKFKTDYIILGEPQLIVNIPSLTFRILEIYPKQIRFLTNQTDELCLIAVKRNSSALEFVKNQTDELCLIAIKSNPLVLKYVKNQTDEMCLIAVKSNALALKYVKNQTDELCLIAVKTNVKALEYVKNQTDEMCLIAVKKYGNALQFVKNQTDEMCLIAVKVDGYALKFVNNKTDEICLIAIKKYGCALEFVKNQTNEICIEAIKNMSVALKFVKNQTDEMCLIAVKKDGYALEFVKNQTDEICIEAIKNNINSIVHIKNINNETNLFKIFELFPVITDVKWIDAILKQCTYTFRNQYSEFLTKYCIIKPYTQFSNRYILKTRYNTRYNLRHIAKINYYEEDIE
jgi:hypothetical protein